MPWEPDAVHGSRSGSGVRERGELGIDSPGVLYPKFGESSEEGDHVDWRICSAFCSCNVFLLEEAEGA